MEPRVSPPEINKQYIRPNESLEDSKGDLGSAVTKSAEYQESIPERSAELDSKLATAGTLSYPESSVKAVEAPVSELEKTQEQIFNDLHNHLTDEQFMDDPAGVTEKILNLTAENRQKIENEILS